MEKRIVLLLLWILVAVPMALVAQNDTVNGAPKPAYQVTGIMETPIWDGKPIDPHCGKVLGCGGETSPKGRQFQDRYPTPADLRKKKGIIVMDTTDADTFAKMEGGISLWDFYLTQKNRDGKLPGGTFKPTTSKM
jgi:hypothetical protein